MKQLITAKLKLQTTPEQFAALRKTQLASRDAPGEVSRYAFAHGKTSSGRALQRDCYQEIRARYKLPAHMACNVPRHVGAPSKTLWTKVKHHAAARLAGQTKQRYKGLDKPPTYVSPTLTYTYHRDYSWKEEAQVSLLSLDGRVIVPYTGYTTHVARIQGGVQLGAAKLWYDTPKKQFSLLITLSVEVAEPIPVDQTQVVGVDVGPRYLAVSTATEHHSTFSCGNTRRAKADQYARLSKRLQNQGTRSVTRRLIVISGRERRLRHDRTHLISRRILEAYPHSIIGLEDLTHIRERTTGRTHKRKPKGKGTERVSSKQRKSTHVHSQWTFAELHGDIAYKATLSGSMTVKVDAYLTSQACPRCGFASPLHRPKKGLLFVRQGCQ